MTTTFNSLESISKTNLDGMNRYLGGLSAAEVLKWSKAEFGSNIYLLSSFGIDSGLMIKMLHESGVEVDVITIDTGFLFNETTEHRRKLQDQYGFNLTIVQPSKEEVDYINKTKLWFTDVKEYNERTKLKPLRQAIKDLGATALISGIRGWQTENRGVKEVLEQGRDGEYRLHPVLGWSQAESDEYLAEVPEHPLKSKGYDSVGDWTTTLPGQGRAGRESLGEHTECGLHIGRHVLKI